MEIQAFSSLIRVSKWSEARNICQNLGGDLAIIRSADENSFTLDLLKKERELPEWGAWLGFHRKADDKFYWIDGTPLEGGYTAWRIGEPNNVRNKEDCGNVLGTGEWNDLYCNVLIHYIFRDDPHKIPFVLCQKKTY